MAGPIASLVVRLGINSGPFSNGLKKAVKSAKSFGQGFKKAIKFAAVGSLALLAGAAAGVLKTAQSLDVVGKSADAIGISTEGLIGLSHAAEQGGASASVMEAALQKVQRRAQFAADGNKAYGDAVRSLGVSTADFVKLPAEQKMRVIADRLKGMTSGSEKGALAFKLLGNSGAKLLPTLQGGSEGLDRMQGEAERMGLTVDRNTIAALERFHDSLDTTKKVATGAFRQTTAALAPIFGGFSDLTRHVIDSWSVSAKGSEEFVFKMASAIAEGINFITKDFEAFFFQVDLGWSSIKLAAIESMNSILGAVASLSDKLPDRAKKLLGLDGKPLTIDTSEVKAEIKILQGFIADIYKAPGLGDVFFDGFVKTLRDINKAAKIEAPVVDFKVPPVAPTVAKVKKARKAIVAAATPSNAELRPIAAWFKEAGKGAERLEAQAAATLTTLSAGLGEATAQAIFFSQNFGTGLMTLFRNAGAQIVSTLVDIGIRMALTSALSSTLMASTAAASAVSIAAVTATSGAAAATNASLWSTAAYFASVATLGGAAGIGLGALLTGLAAATGAQIAAQGANVGFSVALSALGAGAKAGQAHDGLSSVPSTGTYLLESGERVVDSRLNGDLKAYLARQTGQPAPAPMSSAPPAAGLSAHVAASAAIAAAESRVAQRFAESLATGSGAYAAALRRYFRRRPAP